MHCTAHDMGKQLEKAKPAKPGSSDTPPGQTPAKPGAASRSNDGKNTAAAAAAAVTDRDTGQNDADFEKRLESFFAQKMEGLMTKMLEDKMSKTPAQSQTGASHEYHGETLSQFDDSHHDTYDCGYDYQGQVAQQGSYDEDDTYPDGSGAGDKTPLKALEADPDDESGVPLLAAKFAQPSDVGEAVDNGIAQSAAYLLTHKLEEKTIEDTSAKYPVPKNCSAAEVPKVNPPIWDNLKSSTKSRDLKLQRIQSSLSRGLVALMRTLDSSQISEEQQDALALLSNTNFELNCLRKHLIRPDLNSRFTHLCKPTTPVGKFLFGDDLPKQVKDLQEQQKATAGVMKGPGQAKVRQNQFHPYSRNKYRDAGWSTSSGPSTTSRPSNFLGARQPQRGLQGQYGNFRRSAAPAARGRPPQPSAPPRSGAQQSQQRR